MVVVPTDTHVSLHYGRTGVDWAGNILTLLGVVGLVGLSRWKLMPLGPRPRRRRVETAGAPPGAGHGSPEGGSGGPSEDEAAPVPA